MARGRVWRGASYAVPFLLVGFALRWVTPGWGDWIGRRVARVAAFLPRAPEPALHRQAVVHAPRLPCTVVVPEAGAPLVAYVPSARVPTLIAYNSRSIRASTVRGARGEPAGVRLSGVTSIGVGLLDDDVVVCVEGDTTLDEDSAVDTALSAIARGAPVLHAIALRGDQLVSLTADWPPVPVISVPGQAR
jgi:hypothetical protein